MKKLLLLLIVFAPFLLPNYAHAAISFVGKAAASSTPNTDTTVTISGLGLAQDDLVIVAGAIGDAGVAMQSVVNNTAGYTKINNLLGEDDFDTHFAVWYKFMGAVPDTSVVIEGSTGGTNSSLAVVVMAFRGVDTGTPFDVASTSATGANSPEADPPSIDHNNPSGVWTVIAGSSGHTLNANQTYTMPTGYTTNAISGGMIDTNDVTVGMGYNSAPADPEDPGIMNHSGTDALTNSWGAFTMALRPSTAPTVSTDAETNVNSNSATLNGNITATGGSDATVRGFAWGTNSTLTNGDTSTTTETGSFGTGTFGHTIQTLLANKTYYFRAYATNPTGTGYGATIDNFITSAADTALSRNMRLFEGFRIRLIDGRIILRQQ